MIRTGKELAAACERVAREYKTVYVLGCFGAPMTPKNQQRYLSAHSGNRVHGRKEAILGATPDTFGFDCACLVKGLLWGWAGEETKVYGGAVYESNGVPDLGADRLFGKCTEISDDFSDILPGEALWISGHMGIYIGNGLAVEATPAWAGGVQVTAVANKGKPEGYPARRWEKHGRLPYVTYAWTDPQALGLLLLTRGGQTLSEDALEQLVLAYQRKAGLPLTGIGDGATCRALLAGEGCL